MEALVETAIQFVRDNRDWAGPIAFFFAFAETLALASILIPSTAILIGVGAVVATGALDFTPIWIGAAIGAILGSTISYLLGWRFGPTIMGWWPMNRYPHLVTKASEVFAKYGIITVLIGHFFGPLRAVVFLMAGIARMKLPLFLVVNIIGCIAWAFFVPKSGELGGNAAWWIWEQLTGR